MGHQQMLQIATQKFSPSLASLVVPWTHAHTVSRCLSSRNLYLRGRIRRIGVLEYPKIAVKFPIGT